MRHLEVDQRRRDGSIAVEGLKGSASETLLRDIFSVHASPKNMLILTRLLNLKIGILFSLVYNYRSISITIDQRRLYLPPG